MDLSQPLSADNAATTAIDQLNADAFQERHRDTIKLKMLAETALQQAEAANYERGIIDARNNLAWFYFSIADYIQAAKLAQECVYLAHEKKLWVQEADARITLGDTYSALGDYAHALEELLHALRLSEQAQHRYNIACAINDIGLVYAITGDYENALEHYLRALEYDHDSPTLPYGEAVCLVNCCEAYIKLGNYPQALECGLQSRGRFQECGDLLGEANALLNVSNIYRLMGNYDLAWDNLQQLLEITRENSNKEIQINAQISVAQFYLDTNQAEKALMPLQDCMQQATSRGYIFLVAEVHKLFAQAYKQSGQYQQALEHHEKFHTTREALFNQQSDSRLKSLQAVHHVETARKEAELLRLRSLALEQKIEEMYRTEQARLEQERLRLALAQEHEFSQIKTKLMRRISHELRTPLTIIQTSSALLDGYRERMSPERMHHHFEVVSEQTQHIITILDDISLVVQNAEAPSAFTPRSTDLRALCDEVMQDLNQQCAGCDRVMLVIPEDLPDQMIDPHLIRRSLGNLLSNAVKFSSAGSPIYLKIDRDQQTLVIQVKDGGIGIPSDEQPRIFEPMFRGSNVHEVGGTGLGLTVVQTCVAAHGGTIKIESVVNAGTTVTITIPVS